MFRAAIRAYTNTKSVFSDVNCRHCWFVTCLHGIQLDVLQNFSFLLGATHRIAEEWFRVKNDSLARYKFGHLILHTDKGYELTIPVNHNPLYVLAAVGNLGIPVVPFMNRSDSSTVAE